MAFEDGLNKLLDFEMRHGAYSSGKGGEFYCGISRRYFPRWAGWAIIDNFADKENIIHEDLRGAVSDFYYMFFWMKLGCQHIDNAFIAGMIFNIAVFMGKKQTIKKVQRVLQIKSNGVLGPDTVAAINDMDSKVFIYHFILELVEFYAQV